MAKRTYNPEDYPRSVAQVNAFLRQQGFGEYELVRGEGYYYWSDTDPEGLETVGWETDSIAVYRVYEMTYQRWLDDLKDKIETNSEEYKEAEMDRLAKKYNMERTMRVADRLIERELREAREPRIVVKSHTKIKGQGTETDIWDEEPVEAFDDSESLADAAVEQLTGSGVTGASSGSWKKGVYYDNGWDADPSTGESVKMTFHLKGFKPDEEEYIFNKLKELRAI